MSKFDAIADALAKCGGDAHMFAGLIEAAGFDIVSRQRYPKIGRASQLVRMAVDAHSPLPQFYTQQILDWVQKNEPMPRKQVYNALGYLTRQGEIETLGRGVYRRVGSTSGPRKEMR